MLGLLVVGITLFVQSIWQPNKHSITIAVSKTPLSTPFYVAKAINAFEDTCVNVNFQPVIGGQVAFAKVMNEEVDFGTSSDSVIAFNSLKNKSFVTHAMFVQSNNDVKLLTRTSANIHSVIQLKNKRVGVTKGTASEYFLTTLLALNGVETDDVSVVHFKPEQLKSAYLDNAVDAIVPWEPFAYQSVRLLSDDVKVHDTKNLNTLSFNLVSKKPDSLLIEKAKCVLTGLSLAIDYIALYPEKSQQIVMNELGLKPEFIQWVWPDYIFKLSLNQSLVLSIKAQAVWAVESGMTEQKELPNFNQFIDSRAMLQVDPRAVNIAL